MPHPFLIQLAEELIGRIVETAVGKKIGRSDPAAPIEEAFENWWNRSEKRRNIDKKYDEWWRRRGS